MKKLFTPIAIFALAAILFSSCSNSSKLAFTKRHYRSGYFVDRIGKAKNVSGTASVSIKPKQQIVPIVAAKSETPLTLNVPANKLQNEQISSGRTINSEKTDKTISTANSAPLNNLTTGPVLENKEAIAASAGDGGGSGAGAALSLLWIVIVIILIIWLIAVVVGGFSLGGGLINLLLLLALILLILWLLRVW